MHVHSNRTGKASGTQHQRQFVIATPPVIYIASCTQCLNQRELKELQEIANSLGHIIIVTNGKIVTTLATPDQGEDSLNSKIKMNERKSGQWILIIPEFKK
jgi:hypothetical protein